MDKNIYLSQEERNKMLSAFAKLKDEYAPNSADSASILKEVVDAIESNTLTKEHLKRMQKYDSYLHIMNMLRTIRLNFDVTKFEEE